LLPVFFVVSTSAESLAFRLSGRSSQLMSPFGFTVVQSGLNLEIPIGGKTGETPELPVWLNFKFL
jgi:hypothetical protein